MMRSERFHSPRPLPMRMVTVGLWFLTMTAIGVSTKSTIDSATKPDADKSAHRRLRNLLTGGQVTDDRFPYFARIPLASGYYCAGSLVAPDMILTTPMCTDISHAITVGFQNTQSHLDNDVRLIEAIYTHPSYHNETFANAFAVIKLTNSSSLAFVTLNTDPNLPSIASQVNALGAGSGSTARNTLQQVSLISLDNAQCETSRNPAGFAYVMDNSTMCAQGGELAASNGFCEDDWGGPLILQQGDDNATTVQDHLQVGIISWTFGCGSGSPGVFSRVSDGYEWIRTTICEHSVAPQTYLACVTRVDTDSANRDVQVPHSSSAPLVPIAFQYEVEMDGYFYENGIVVERIRDLTTEIVHRIVPGALPYFGTFQKVLQLEHGGLYSFAVMDSPGDGLELPDENVINLYLLQEDDAGNFTKFAGRDPDFTYRANFIFYAALGEVTYDFANKQAFSGTEEVRIVIVMDDYPWEIGLEIRASDDTLIWYRPPRYYSREVRETVVEIVSLPERSDLYTLTVGDTFGDGLGASSLSGVRATRTWGQELGSTSFATGFRASFSFAYDPSVRAPPTDLPVETPSASLSLAGSLSCRILLWAIPLGLFHWCYN